MYLKMREEHKFVRGVYVDNPVVIGSNSDLIRDSKKEIMHLFEMSDLGLLRSYQGIDVMQYD